MKRDVWFFGGVFCRRDGHKQHRKVVGKGNAPTVSKVNKGRGVGYFLAVFKEDEEGGK